MIRQNPFGLQNVNANCWFNALMQFLMSSKRTHQVSSISQNPLQMEYIKLHNNKQFSQQFLNFMSQIDQKSITKSVEEAFDFFLDKSDQAIQNLFTLRYKNTIECPCGYKSSTPDITTNLRIPLEINDHLGYIIEHKTPIDFNCPNCKSKIPYRTETLVHMGELLFIICNKTNKAFPDKLILSKNDKERIQMNLIASIEHISDGGGHYFACGVCDDKWYLFDDEKIIPLVNFQNSPNTYALLYELK